MRSPLVRVAAAVALALTLGACSTSGGTTDTSGGGSAKIDAGAAQRVADLKALPKFVAPGPAVDVSKLRGKKVFVLPLLTTNEYNNEIIKGLERVAAKAGIAMEVYSNEGQPNQWVAGMNQAIAKKVDLILLSGGTDPRALQPQIKAAKAAGIPVEVTMFWDTSAKNAPECGELSVDCVSGVDAYVAAPYQVASRANVDWIAVDSKGTAQILVIKSDDAGPSPGQEAAIKDQLAKVCPSCKATYVNVPISKWTTSVQSTVQSELVRNPKIDYILPLYDNLSTYTVAGITAAGKKGKVKVVTFNGTPAVLKDIQTGDTVAMDVGESLEGIAFAAMDNAFRLLAGMEPSRNEVVPVRVFDKTNVDEAGTPPTVNKGYGDLEQNYLTLWGLG